MNRIQKLFNEQAGKCHDFSYDHALRRLCVAKEDSWRGILPSNYSSDYNPEPPIFSAKFARCSGYGHLLAIANEDGKIALQDITERNYELEEKALNAPQCHYNAVFDLEWAPGQMKFVSASGDHTARLWEVVGSGIRSVRVFNGHTRSVKTAAFRKNDASVFATGGRDGAIIIWDTRANLNLDLTPRADNCIYSGHVGGPGTPVSQKKRLRTPKYAPNATSSSITGLVFQDINTLISCGAGDGIIKVWDLRRNYTAYKKEPLPKNSLPYAGSSTFKGFTNLLIDESGSKLFANCMDNTIYSYNLFSCSPKPLARYKGLLNSTFYIKACLSPDGKYILSGSSDEKAYIWNLNYPDEPLVALSGHTVEVTCVAWGSTHDQPIVTCSDDARHKIWRIGPETLCATEKSEFYRGHAEYVRTFGTRNGATGSWSTHKYNLRELESTPRSLKRLVEQNERTPSSLEKVSTKRSFLEMLGAAPGVESSDEQQQQQQQHPDAKRPKTLESRGRRLFSPSTSSNATCSGSFQSVRCLSVQLTAIPEERCSPGSSFTANLNISSSNEQISPLSHHQLTNDESNQENTSLRTPETTLVASPCMTKFPYGTNTPSPLSERAEENLNHSFTSPPTISSVAGTPNATVYAASQLSAINSPTTNLPNYVLDGDAPHLSIMSPKRKLKEKVDWLTKIRKQKLMSSCRGVTLSDKMHEEHLEEMSTMNSLAASPRLASLRVAECGGSPRQHATPRRRISHSSSHCSPTSSHHHHNHQHSQHPKTPTSSRRNSETTILRFFSVQQQQQRNDGTDSSSTLVNASAALTPVVQQLGAVNTTTCTE